MSSNWGEETRRYSEWSSSFATQVDKEHKERTELLRKELMEAIHDAEQRLDSKILNAQSQFSSAVQSYDSNVESYKQAVIDSSNQRNGFEERIKALEERLIEPVPENEE